MSAIAQTASLGTAPIIEVAGVRMALSEWKSLPEAIQADMMRREKSSRTANARKQAKADQAAARKQAIAEQHALRFDAISKRLVAAEVVLANGAKLNGIQAIEEYLSAKSFIGRDKDDNGLYSMPAAHLQAKVETLYAWLVGFRESVGGKEWFYIQDESLKKFILANDRIDGAVSKKETYSNEPELTLDDLIVAE